MANEVDSFLEDISPKKDDPFKEESSDPFEKTAPKAEEKVEEEVKEEKPLPFHKDPKVQRFIEKELTRKMGELKTSQPQATAAEVKDEADEILTRIIGNDTPEKVSAIRDFKRYLSSLEEKGAEKAISQLQKKQEEERQAEVEAREELDRGFDSIEETYGVDISSNSPLAKKMRNEFVDFIKRVSPKDENGEVVQFPDLMETFALFQDMNKAKTPSRAKEAASRSMARSNDASTVPVNDDKSWKAVDKLFSKF